MHPNSQVHEQFDSLFRQHELSYNGKSGGEWHRFQKAAFEQLMSMSIPDRKQEDWKNTPVQKLFSDPLTISTNPETVQFKKIQGFESLPLHLINGQAPDLAEMQSLREKGIHIMPLHEAITTHAWKESFMEWVTPALTKEVGVLDWFNLAFTKGGIFIHIPKDVHVDVPIELRITHTSSTPSWSMPLYFLRSDQNSSVTIFERIESQQDGKGLLNSVAFLHARPQSRIEHIKFQDLDQDVHMLYKRLTRQERDSSLSTYQFDLGGQIVRNNVEVNLAGSNTYTKIHGAFIAQRQQSMDHLTRIHHQQPHCESHELYKGIVADKAKAAFNGKVYVDQIAQKTNAYQQNDALVVSPFAVMNSKPQLEIFADDVRCSHGATIGQLDRKAIFYLQSRGIKKSEAEQMLKSAFLGAVIHQVSNETIREYIRNRFSEAS